MLPLSNSLKETLRESLLLHYKALENGDMKTLSSIMQRDSYCVMLHSLGFKRAFKDEAFRMRLQEIETDTKALEEIQQTISEEICKEAKRYDIQAIDYDPKGSDRITLHYTENGHPKKMYFAYFDGSWKIDFKAGRKITT